MMGENLKVMNLNQSCTCQTLDSIQLRHQLKNYKNADLLIEEIITKRPNLFSASTLFISFSDFIKIEKTIKTIEKVFHKIKTSNYEEASGVFMGFDFHLTEQGPRLIEINTNAGGGLLNLELAKAQIQCIDEKNEFFDESRSLTNLHKIFFQMFLNEWRLLRPNQELKTIAIVDENPSSQFLFPEFLLFKELIEANGLECLICDPSALDYKEKNLYFKDHKIDLVYNRLTDFYLTNKTSEALKKAYQNKAIVLTPSPFHFDLYANKRQLTLLTNQQELKVIGISDEDIKTLLTFIPNTVSVNSTNQQDLWNDRKNYFFKPTIGYGSKATYRGDKLTTRVWEEIIKSDYVAQKLAPPSKKVIIQEGNPVEVKVDVRAYVYEGKIQLLAARLYSGQTTNFRTPGGGFAPVFVIS